MAARKKTARPARGRKTAKKKVAKSIKKTATTHGKAKKKTTVKRKRKKSLPPTLAELPTQDIWARYHRETKK
ncbi:MAG: hypothetical protein O7B99_05905, partial [Planctomycetota bacterium]|nr:hypothetical protein [Planctomycetota bacterium]